MTVQMTDPCRRQVPRVTVLMPVYNPGDYLEAAIHSILRQTFTDFEFLIVDDGSDAETGERIAAQARRDSRIRVLRNADNQGVTKTLNRGLAAARGELLARQDADDIALPQRLAAQVAFLDRYPGHVLVGTDCVRIDANGRGRVIDSPGWRDWQLELIALVRTPLVHSTAMFRMAPFGSAGLRYDEGLGSAQDYDLWVRLLDVGRIAVIPQVLVHYREHQAAISSSRRLEQHRFMRAIALRHCLSRLPGLAVHRDAVISFYDLLYLHEPPTPAAVRQAIAGVHAVGAAFIQHYEPPLGPAQRFLVRRLCARWLTMGLLRSGAQRHPATWLPLLRRMAGLGLPLTAEAVDFISRRLRARVPR